VFLVDVTTLRSAVVIAIPSVVRRLSVVYLCCLLSVELFRNIFAPYCSLAIRFGCKENKAKIPASVFPWGCYVQGVQKY